MAFKGDTTVLNAFIDPKAHVTNPYYPFVGPTPHTPVEHELWLLPSQEINWAIDAGSQRLAEKLARDYISKTFAAVLRRLNFLFSVFDPFPPEAHAPTHSDDPCNN